MPAGINADQPRWPAGTPMGLGGQWRPDLTPDAEQLFLGVLNLLSSNENFSHDSTPRGYVERANRALSAQGRREDRAVTREETAEVIGSVIVTPMRREYPSDTITLAWAGTATRIPDGMVARTAIRDGINVGQDLGIPRTGERNQGPVSQIDVSHLEPLAASHAALRRIRALDEDEEVLVEGLAGVNAVSWSRDSESASEQLFTVRMESGEIVETPFTVFAARQAATGSTDSPSHLEQRTQPPPPATGDVHDIDVSNAADEAHATSEIRQGLLDARGNAVWVTNGLNRSLIVWHDDEGTSSGTTFTVSWMEPDGTQRIAHTESDYTAAEVAFRRQDPIDISLDESTDTPDFISALDRGDTTDAPTQTPAVRNVVRPDPDSIFPLKRSEAMTADNPHAYGAERVVSSIPDGGRGLSVRQSQRAARIVDSRNRTVAYVRQRRNDYIIEFMRGDFSSQSAARMPNNARRVVRNAEGAGETFVIPYLNAGVLADAIHDLQHAVDASPVAHADRARVVRRRERPGFPELQEETVQYNGQSVTRLVGMAGVAPSSGSGYGASAGEVQTGLEGEARTFGIEAEIMGITHDAARRALKDRGLPVDDRSNYSAKNAMAWLATEDVSIAGNPEIKFPPLTGDAGLDLLRHGLDALAAEGGRQGFQNEYGLHVHIGAADLSHSERDAATKTYQNNRNLMEQMIAINRRGTLWAVRGVGQHHGSMEITDDQSKPTIEFRRLGSTLDPAALEGWIVMLRSIVNKAKEDGTAIPSQPNMNALLAELGITGTQRRLILARAAAVARQDNPVSR